MSALQIVLLSVAGAFSLASVVFMVMFILEITIPAKKKVKEEPEVKSIFSSEEFSAKKDSAQDVNSMLAKLDKEAEQEKPAESKPVEINVQVNTQVISNEKKVEEKPVEIVEEVKPEIVEEVFIEEKKEEVEEVKPVEVVEVVEEKPVEEDVEEVVEEVKPEKTEETVVEVEEVKVEEVKTEAKEEIETIEVQEANDGDMISVENLPDYKARLDKIVENRDKINKDLIKVEKSILNYERTKRRKLRNQKMLDRRASELTNLNLVMYSVTDIKNVDEDKKVKQEELTSHIAELKASIQDADEFLDSNKEKNDHDVKMAKFLIQEKARYNEEIAELQKLIAKTEGTVA